MGKHKTSTAWPVDGLKNVHNCPVCNSNNRELLHEGLEDKMFHAPGLWTMYRCKSCASAYLDPIPTPETIGLAYENYYTHIESPSYSSISLFRQFRRAIANSYRNYRFGTKDYPANLLGLVISFPLKKGRSIVDAGMRHLPKISKKMKLLDLGCGNGAFLFHTSNAGWDVVGADFDSKAVAVASEKGLDVRLGGVENFDPSADQFDVITLSHVIEHVCDPLEVLKACYALLKPGGFLWIETPNIDAEGHSLFGSSWRGLEPPRHLVLFSSKSLCGILKKTGFVDIEVQPYSPACNYMFCASLEIKKGIARYTLVDKDRPTNLIRKKEHIAKINPNKREFITLKAWKH